MAGTARPPAAGDPVADRDLSAAHADGVPRRVRIWALAILSLVVVPGVIGFDLWPLTGWRMYSLSMSGTRESWGIEATTASGAVDVAWVDLPLAYRLAAWPIAEIESASVARRDEVCQALFDVARDVVPGTTSLALVHDRSTFRDDEVSTERERFHRCGGL